MRDDVRDDARDDGRDADGRSAGGGQHDAPTTPEWVIGALSTALVLLLLGYLAFQALFQPTLPPMVDVRVTGVRGMPAGGYLAEVEAHNRGSTTAANVTLQAELKRDTATVEQSQTTLTFVPGGSATRGGVYFEKDPRLYRLEVRALGYQKP